MNKADWDKISLKELAGLINKSFERHNISAVLVGGACVSIYSKNKYQSYDLDYITNSTMRELTVPLKEIGFIRKGSRYFKNAKCPYIIDFPAPPVSIGSNEVIKEFQIYKTKRGDISLLTPTDCIRDRLAAFIYWKDRQALEQAIMVTKAQLELVNIKLIKQWAKRENALAKLIEYFDLFDQIKLSAHILKKP